MNNSPLIVALDFPNATQALSLVEQIDPNSCRLKIGKELFTREGPVLVRQLVDNGFDVFLDLKFHDIPNTVGKAVSAAADLGVWMLNVHASGGHEMMEAARSAIESRDNAPILIAVTVLTSMSQSTLADLGVSRPLDAQVSYLADSAQSAGLDGVVCSAREAGFIKRSMGESFLTVTPGIRPLGSDLDDQHRIMSPSDAIAAGSDYLVVGRPITQAENPAHAITSILESLQSRV